MGKLTTALLALLTLAGPGLAQYNPGGSGSGSGGSSGQYSTASVGYTTAAPFFFPPGGGLAASTTEAAVQGKATIAGTIANFSATLSAAPGANTLTFTWRKNGADQAITCAITGAATSCSDLTHNFAVVAGDLLDIKAVATTGTVTAAVVLQWGTPGVAGPAGANGAAGPAQITLGTTATSGATDTQILNSTGGFVGQYALSGSGSVCMTISCALTTPNLGTPSAVVLTNGTGLPISTGVTGLATGIAAFLASPTSANLLATLTTKTGTGLAVFGTSPTLSGLTLSDVATGTQCLHANSSGLVTGTGSDCGAGGGGSVFTGSTAVTSVFSATPTFSLADVSVKSPVRFQPGALTANVTSVTFTNKTAGAKFSIAWLQDGTGARTIAYGASASNTCTISATASKTTVQQFEVAADGTTVIGTGCSSDDPLDTPVTGPASSTTNHCAQFADTSGKVISDTGSPCGGGGGIANTQGAYSSLPATCTTGDQYILTDSFYQTRCSATNTWSFFRNGHAITLPGVASGWTVVNGASGTAAISDSRGAVILKTTSSVSGIEAALKAVPATPYTITIPALVAASVSANTIDVKCGLVATSGTTTASNVFMIGFDSANTVSPHSIRVFETVDFSESTFSLLADTYGIFPTGPGYFQIQDDGTNHKFLFSADGVNFNQLYSEASSAHFTITNYGFGCDTKSSTGVPWAITALGVNSGAQ